MYAVVDLELLHLAAVETTVDGTAASLTSDRAPGDDLGGTAGSDGSQTPLSDGGAGAPRRSSIVHAGPGKLATGRRGATLMSEDQLPTDGHWRPASTNGLTNSDGPPAKPPETSSSVLTSTPTSAASAATSRRREQGEASAQGVRSCLDNLIIVTGGERAGPDHDTVTAGSTSAKPQERSSTSGANSGHGLREVMIRKLTIRDRGGNNAGEGGHLAHVVVLDSSAELVQTGSRAGWMLWRLALVRHDENRFLFLYKLRHGSWFLCVNVKSEPERVECSSSSEVLPSVSHPQLVVTTGATCWTEISCSMSAGQASPLVGDDFPPLVLHTKQPRAATVLVSTKQARVLAR